jgi:hypothetical protein
MKKQLALLIISLFVFSFVSATMIRNPVGTTSIVELINAIIDWMVQISSILVVIFIVIGGMFIAIAGGDTNRLDLGKKTIIFSVVGYLIILSAKALITFFASWLE